MPQFYMRTADVTGKVELPEDVKMVLPGDNVTAVFELIQPVTLEPGIFHGHLGENFSLLIELLHLSTTSTLWFEQQKIL